uniref:Uncharacterized protein n=1 Tax=Brassica oleracea var. oleracea TaxID=109376 RepID=A0A0D2ZVE1_BRAOL
MHHHPKDQERALNLSILILSGPVKVLVPPTASEGHEVPQKERPSRISTRGEADRPARGEADRPARPKLELPRLLAPDLPSNCSSLRDLNCSHSNYETQKSPVSVFIVTTSPSRDWVICAPAAFLGCGSRFSGSLSGVEP